MNVVDGSIINFLLETLSPERRSSAGLILISVPLYTVKISQAQSWLSKPTEVNFPIEMPHFMFLFPVDFFFSFCFSRFSSSSPANSSSLTWTLSANSFLLARLL